MPVAGDIPSPLERPKGCVFHTRCDRMIKGFCDTQVPERTEIEPDHTARCFDLTKTAEVA